MSIEGRGHFLTLAKGHLRIWKLKLAFLRNWWANQTQILYVSFQVQAGLQFEGKSAKYFAPDRSVSPIMVVKMGSVFRHMEARWLSGRASDSGPRGPEFEPHDRCVVSLRKALSPSQSTNNTQEEVAPSQHDWKIVYRDVKHQSIQTISASVFLFRPFWGAKFGPTPKGETPPFSQLAQ